MGSKEPSTPPRVRQALERYPRPEAIAGQLIREMRPHLRAVPISHPPHDADRLIERLRVAASGEAFEGYSERHLRDHLDERNPGRFVACGSRLAQSLEERPASVKRPTAKVATRKVIDHLFVKEVDHEARIAGREAFVDARQPTREIIAQPVRHSRMHSRHPSKWTRIASESPRHSEDRVIVPLSGESMSRLARRTAILALVLLGSAATARAVPISVSWSSESFVGALFTMDSSEIGSPVQLPADLTASGIGQTFGGLLLTRGLVGTTTFEFTDMNLGALQGHLRGDPLLFCNGTGCSG